MCVSLQANQGKSRLKIGPHGHEGHPCGPLDPFTQPCSPWKPRSLIRTWPATWSSLPCILVFQIPQGLNLLHGCVSPVSQILQFCPEFYVLSRLIPNWLYFTYNTKICQCHDMDRKINISHVKFKFNKYNYTWNH